MRVQSKSDIDSIGFNYGDALGRDFWPFLGDLAIIELFSGLALFIRAPFSAFDSNIGGILIYI
jgi:hypothetical protein